MSCGYLCGVLSFGPQVLYPLYLTYDLFDQFDFHQKEQYVPQLLNLSAYWAIYIIWNAFEHIFPFNALTATLPLYGILKSLVCLWLVHPQTGGAASFWFQTVKPWLKDKIAFVDPQLSRQWYDSLTSTLSSVYKRAA